MAFANYFAKTQSAIAAPGKWTTKAVWERLAQVKRAIQESYIKAIRKNKTEVQPKEIVTTEQHVGGAKTGASLTYRIPLHGYRATLKGYSSRIQQQVAVQGKLHGGQPGHFCRDFIWRRIRTRHLVGFATLFLVHEENLEEEARSRKRWQEYTKLCENIKSIFAQKPNLESDLIASPLGSSIKEFKLGNCIAVGANGAVYEAQLDTSELGATEAKLPQECLSSERRHSMATESENTGSKNTEIACSHNKSHTQPLAVKMVFNFESSNAGAIQRLTRSELINCGRGAISSIQKDWQNGTRARMKWLPPHPNIIRVHRGFIDKIPNHPDFAISLPAALPYPIGFGRSSTMFLIMKRYHCTLHDYLKEYDPTLASRHLLALQLLQGVAHLERNKVAHRDLKANNILMEFDSAGFPRLVISDFGCSFVPSKEEDLVFPFLSELYDIRNGSAQIQPPEIACCKAGPKSVLDYRKSDAWAAGILLKEMLGPECEQKSDNDGSRRLFMQNLIDRLCMPNVDERISCRDAANILHLELFGPKFKGHSSSTEQSLLVTLSEWLLLHSSETLAYKAKLGQDSVICETFFNFLSSLSVSDLSRALIMWRSLQEF